jgi:tRNA (guanine-N7-)-methyltransferase
VNFALFDPDSPLPRSWWLEQAPSVERVELEIGAGSCGFLLEAARRSPSTLYAGFEIRVGLVKAFEAAGDKPPNALLYGLDGRWVTSCLLAPDSIDTFHVYFPDPWWKKRHHKRRLFTGEFCRGVARSLNHGGELKLVTDVRVIYESALDGLLEAGLVQRPGGSRPEDPAEKAAEPACSAYETKYRRQGRELHEAVFVRGGAA